MHEQPNPAVGMRGRWVGATFPPFPRNLSQAKEMTASKVTLQAAHVKQFNDMLRSIEPSTENMQNGHSRICVGAQ